MKVIKKQKTAIVVIEREKLSNYDPVTSGVPKRTSADNDSRDKKLAIHPFFTKYKVTVKKEVALDQPANSNVKVLKSIKRQAGAASRAVKKRVTWADDVNKGSDDDDENNNDDYMDDDDQPHIKDENTEDSDIKLTIDSGIVKISVAEKKQMD